MLHSVVQLQSHFLHLLTSSQAVLGRQCSSQWGYVAGFCYMTVPGIGHSFVNYFKWILRVIEANKGFNKMKWSIHQVNERMNGSDWQWKQEKIKTKNTGMHSQMIKDEWRMMNDGYEVYCLITMIKIQYSEWLVYASIYLSISFISHYSFIPVIYSLQSALLV